MKVKFRFFPGLLSFVSIAMVMVSAAHAQQDPKIVFDQIEVKKAENKSGHAAPEEKTLRDSWTKFSATFEVDTGDRKMNILEELTIRIYVAAEDKLFRNEPVTLIAESTFINVMNAKKHMIDFYISPTAQKRYGGDSKEGYFKAGGGRDFNIHFEAIVRGRTVAEKDLVESGFEKTWFRTGKQVSGVVLGLPESPWWPFDALKYNQFKSKTR